MPVTMSIQPSMDESPKVSCVVLNWNNYEDTSNCIKSLIEQDYDNFDIIVVDNGSVDGSGTKLKQQFDSINVVFNATNLGFAGGMNRGIEIALENDTEYVWILNNDIVVKPKSLCRLVDRMTSNVGIGVLSPKILDFDNNLWFSKGVVNWWIGRVTHSEPDESEEGLIDNDYIPLAAALIDADVIEEAGIIPENYFLYFEDVEFSQEVKNLNRDVYTDLATTVLHKGSASGGGETGPIFSYYIFRNYFLFKKKYSELVGLGFYPYYFILFLYGVIRRLTKKELNGLIGQFRGFLDGIKLKSGKGEWIHNQATKKD